MRTESERLQILYEVNRRLTTFTDLDDLLRYATRRGRELLDAEGCAVLLIDRVRGDFHFPVASQSEARAASGTRLADVRFPANQGIAGWVLDHDEAALVADVATDRRFYRGVDAMTGLTTRAILCAPMRTRGGNIGVLEVINPAQGARAEDLQFLETLASDIAVAHEKARLYERLRSEVIGLRQACGFTGAVLALVGLATAAGSILTHLARALPWRELPARPGMLMGAGCVVAGMLLLGVARGRLVPPAEHRPDGRA